MVTRIGEILDPLITCWVMATTEPIQGDTMRIIMARTEPTQGDMDMTRIDPLRGREERF